MPVTEFASINPKLLFWARDVSGYTLEEAAQKVQIAPEKLDQAERFPDVLTIPQLRKMAELYKRPIDIFYLNEPPAQLPIPKDFRTKNNDNSELSPKLRVEWRRSILKRNAALELMREQDREPVPLSISALQTESPETVAIRLNEWLESQKSKDIRVSEERHVLQAWINLVEARDILVFQTSKFDISDARGLSYPAEILPFILLNGKDTPRPRLFTLIHELVHLILHGPGSACTPLFGGTSRSPLEAFCNKVAAAVLIPQEEILSQSVVQDHQQTKKLWADQEIKQLSKKYGTSRQVLLIRLQHLNVVSSAFVRNKIALYEKEYEEELEEKGKPSGGGIPRHYLALRDNGPSFAKLVLSAVLNQQISAVNASTYLDLGSAHFENLRLYLGMGGAFT